MLIQYINSCRFYLTSLNWLTI